MNHAQIVSEFIEQIWNQRNFDRLAEFMHPDFKDYSLPAALPANTEGMKQWILNTGMSFEHHTIIEDQVTEGNKSIVKIKMIMKHIGRWRDFDATGIEVTTAGYRFYILQDGKIIEHRALIDGQAIENQLLHVSRGCKIAE
jgi:predicted ester cyclase